MREINIGAESAGKRLDKWLQSKLPALPMGLMQKYIRLKRIKINGKGTQRDVRLNQGDRVSLYIGDEFFALPQKTDSLLGTFHHHLHIVYEDAQILLVDKRPGMIVHPDEKEKLNTLVTHARAYLYQKGEYDSMDPHAFSPVPCNRIDRFTGGIVMIAKTREAMEVLNQKIRDREIAKFYLCAIHGHMNPPNGTLEGFLFKPEGQRRVRVLHHAIPGAQYALTRYRTLAERDGLSLLECELLTGRTHQIRAQFAESNHPLLGDGQYGDEKLDQPYGRAYQALYAYRILFEFQSEAGVLDHLNGKSFSVRDVAFVREYFPKDS